MNAFSAEHMQNAADGAVAANILAVFLALLGLGVSVLIANFAVPALAKS